MHQNIYLGKLLSLSKGEVQNQNKTYSSPATSIERERMSEGQVRECEVTFKIISSFLSSLFIARKKG